MKIWLIIGLCCCHAYCTASLSSAHTEGQSLGSRQNEEALKESQSLRAEDLLPKNSQAFDAQQGLKNMKAQRAPSSETVDFLTSPAVRRNERENKNFHPDEYFLKHAEELAAQTSLAQDQSQEEQAFSLHTCRQAGEPFLITVERTLNVQLSYQPEEEAKVCLGHEKFVLVEKKGDFKQSTKDLNKKFENDATIKEFTIDCMQAHPTPGHFATLVHWVHQANTKGCDQCKTKKIKAASYQESGDEWVYDQPEQWKLAQQVENTIIEHRCIDEAPTKMIKGQSVARRCWKEQLTFLYQFPQTKECESLKHQHCEQMNQICLEQTPFGCALWELSFRCFDQVHRQTVYTDAQDLYGFKEYSHQQSYSVNRSFAEVAAKVAIFDEAKKDLEKSENFDASSLEIFKGQKMTCSKNVADRLMYDCCFNYSGLATKIGLSKCSADELSLAEMREQGLCYYVGSYEEKVLDLWKSRDEHVFCCFSSKLARLVQEEGRKQLKRDWGKAKKPDCGGFTFDVLSKIDFTQLDLSEMFDQIPHKLSADFHHKLQAFQNRLQDQIEKEEPQLEKKKRV